MSIAITPIEAHDQATIDEAYRIGVAAGDADLPDLPVVRRRFEGALRHPMPGNLPVWALARLDGVPAGYYAVELPQLDNTDNATIDLVVHPAYRRRGVGRALHAHALGLLRERGRKRLVGMAVDALPGGPSRSPAGSAFAASTGAAPVLVEARRRLDVTTVEQAALDAALAEAWTRADGYRLVGWRQNTPEEYVADIAYLDGRLMMDAPLGDLEWEPEAVDAERVRGAERALDARGRRRYHQGVVHVASGRVVAWTLLDVDPDASWHAFQQITLVDPAHRGHRLGLIVKIENLRYAMTHEPQLRVVDTWNATTNQHMIAINEQLGYRPVDNWTDWQLTL
ncbi:MULTISPECIES: GNAT family N-acetyltransferase [Micromonospora]|nr:GNAT family N-acetyltransferase [Micromonospora yangpuensis]GGM13606.1 GNAT family N-acetyltransferase [Micromonospora yangpuensis]